MIQIKNLKIDLHMHSNVSDGTDSPEELIHLVKKAGIGLFSLTDHDAISGSEEILRVMCAVRDGREGQESPACGTDDFPAFIPGVEFSCRDEEGKYHILGYGYDPSAPGIRSVVERGHSLRMRKVHGRLEFLKERFGFDFRQDDLKKLLGRPNPGKPHIANLMVKYGFAPSKEEAITKYIDKKRFRSEYITPREAIRGILEGGGVPVLGHPSYGDGGQLVIGEEMHGRIRRLMEFGLQGLEAFYSGFTPKLQNELLGFASRYNLYVTAGSDYHGSNKLVRLGENNLERVEDAPEGLQRFLGRVT